MKNTTKHSTAEIYAAYRAKFPAPKPIKPAPLTWEALERAFSRRPPNLRTRPPMNCNGRPPRRGEIF